MLQGTGAAILPGFFPCLRLNVMNPVRGSWRPNTSLTTSLAQAASRLGSVGQSTDPGVKGIEPDVPGRRYTGGAPQWIGDGTELAERHAPGTACRNLPEAFPCPFATCPDGRVTSSSSAAWRCDQTAGCSAGASQFISRRPKGRCCECSSRPSGSLVDRNTIVDRVWGQEAVCDQSLVRSVHYLRTALGAQADGSSFIETAYRRGYRLSAPIRRVPPVH